MEFVNGKDDIPYIMENKSLKLETTNQSLDVTQKSGRETKVAGSYGSPDRSNGFPVSNPTSRSCSCCKIRITHCHASHLILELPSRLTYANFIRIILWS